MAKTSSLHVRIEPKIKEEVENILDNLGMTSAEAINIYFKQIILTSGIPFEIKIPNYSDEMLEAIEEANEIEKNPEKYKKYNSVEELMKELENE